MELHGNRHKRRHSTGVGHTLRELDAATQRAVEVASLRVGAAIHEGRLLSPGEALALAGPEAQHDETLFSIARAVAWESGCDQDEILNQLAVKFPAFVE